MNKRRRLILLFAMASTIATGAVLPACYSRTVDDDPFFSQTAPTTHKPNYKTGDDRDIFDHIGDAIFGDGDEN